MSSRNMSLIVLGVGTVVLPYSPLAAARQGVFFEGCGVLGMSQGGEPCLAFFPESGEFPRGLGRLADGWGSFQEGDRIHAAGVLLDCATFCSIGPFCLDDDSVIDVCPPIATVSEWGMIALGLLVLVGGTIVIRRGSRHCYSAGAFCVFVLLAVCTSSFAQDSLIAHKVDRMLEGPHDPQRLLVRFKSDTPQAARTVLHGAAGTVRIKSYRFVDGLTLVKVPGGDLSAALTSYLSDANVLYAEPDYVAQVGAVPNDTHFSKLWGMQNTGWWYGLPEADIRAVQAWDIWTGDPNFRIAVIDSGVNYNHPDLMGNIWTNPLEQEGDANCDGCPGVCGIDDDGDGLTDECPEELPEGASCSWDDDENGWVDDIHGYDFRNDDADPWDDRSHGSHVAGIIGAVGDNTLGIDRACAVYCWNAEPPVQSCTGGVTLGGETC